MIDEQRLRRARRNFVRIRQTRSEREDARLTHREVRAAEFIPKRHYNWAQSVGKRRMNLGRRRSIPDGAHIHESAFQRGDEYSKRLPTNT